MTARQAETILMLSDFLENCSVLFVPWLKGVAGVPSMISMTLLATAMYVMSIMADTSIKALLIEGHTISA
jgi:hypothetical protein